MTENNTINRVLILCQDDLETIPYHRAFALIDYLREKVDRVDVLYYDRAFDKDVTSIVDKLNEGIHDYFHKPRIQVKADRNITYYGIRRLPVDGILSTWSQDPWIYNKFRKNNKTKYDVCISEAPGPARIARWLKQKGMTKYFIYDDVDYFPGFATGLRSRAIAGQEKKGIRSADSVICVGHNLAELRQQQGAKKVSVIPNGVEVKSYTIPPNPGSHPPTLVYVGSLEEWAGVHLALEAMPMILQKMPDFRFWVLGDGSAYLRLVDLSKKLNLHESVTFFGKKSPVELPQYFAESDIAVITPVPSQLWEYASPLKLFQYMASGLPVISTDIGELAVLVQKYQVGFSIPFDPSVFVTKTIELFENTALRETFRKNSVQAVDNFDWQVLMDTYWNEIMRLNDADRD